VGGPGKWDPDMCKIKYVTGDLFSAPNQESLAHCVSEDLRMGKGIAVLFKKNFVKSSILYLLYSDILLHPLCESFACFECSIRFLLL
uniref:Macro domain-containing protein n=1 Tax=Poecilia mexicana TaxID=48701 RepID=A0A3B3X625_9TELE